MERALANFIEEISSEISSRVYSEGEGATFEDKYTEYCIEVLESIGKSEGARVLSYIHPNKMGGVDWKINGYCLKDLNKEEKKSGIYESLDIFITYFKLENYSFNITKEDYNKTLNQVKKFINESFKRNINYIDPYHSELVELIKKIGSQSKDFDRINVFFLMNGFTSHEKETFEINGVNVYVQNWDIDRLFKVNESNSSHEPIEIEFSEFSSDGNGIQCLHVPSIDEMYECYLAIVPGEILSKLYKEYSNELLESNVRAFLGQTGKYNKGIRDTIREKPHMFLPYNNGITATAESVEFIKKDNQIFITKLNDFQIVNGGQTTASLYHTQKKYKDVSLDKIFVQMKLTVIKDKEQKNIEVPAIAKFANSQNKVSELDLSSNNPYFIQIETLSRRKYVINPNNKNHSQLWFFERANGQYRETLNKKTPSQQKIFKEQNPSNLKFAKSDIAKYINIWEQEPHFVSLGSQKNFVHYTKKITELVSKNKLPGENFYRKLIANAIIVKTVDSLFGRKNVDAIGDTNLKSFTVAYTTSYFHFLTNNRIDLWRIYEHQKTDEEVNICLKKLMLFVYDHLVSEAKGSLISEYAKLQSTWDKLKKVNYPENINEALKKYLISENEKNERDIENETNDNGGDEEIFIKSEIKKLGLKFWDGFKIYIDNSGTKDFAWDSANDLFSNLRMQRNLSSRNVIFGQKVLEYLKDNFSIIDEIKNFSKLPDEEIVDIKFIYDKLLLLSKNDWKKIIDISEQTKRIVHLELSNLKSVSNLILKKEKVKEQAILKAYESIKKLSSFGINI